jgi:hypothetical protein
MSTALLTASGQFQRSQVRHERPTLPVRGQPAPQLQATVATTAKTQGSRRPISHWLGDAFATWATAGRIM